MPLSKQDSLADDLIRSTNDGEFAIGILRVEEKVPDLLKYAEETPDTLREAVLAFNTRHSTGRGGRDLGIRFTTWAYLWRVETPFQKPEDQIQRGPFSFLPLSHTIY
ncbi:hypothetical protein N7452_003657 [Penicillium brevicompactum]|uniref:Uncharacterized protein n=1 Tax=Penicillium brevicompactum TaxID=5074 RepID=A0A9W9UKX9_PENBR|nr:hypothetical protein N7452_003657 [Penicillium brevicompactum]